MGNEEWGMGIGDWRKEGEPVVPNGNSLGWIV